MISESEVFRRLASGESEDSIAASFAGEVNHAFKKWRQEQKKKAKQEQEKKEKAAARDQAREALAKSLVAYFEATGWEVEEGSVNHIMKWLKNTELTGIHMYDFGKLLKLFW